MGGRRSAIFSKLLPLAGRLCWPPGCSLLAAAGRTSAAARRIFQPEFFLRLPCGGGCRERLLKEAKIGLLSLRFCFMSWFCFEITTKSKRAARRRTVHDISRVARRRRRAPKARRNTIIGHFHLTSVSLSVVAACAPLAAEIAALACNKRADRRRRRRRWRARANVVMPQVAPKRFRTKVT